MLTTLPLPRPVQRHAERSPLSLIPAVGKENPGQKNNPSPSIVSLFVRAPTLILPHGDCRGICGA